MRTIVFNDTSIDDHHGCQLVMNQISTLATSVGMDIVVSCPLGYEWESDEWLKAEVRKAELCIVNGEGTMHDDAPNAMRLGHLAQFCAAENIPCVLINSVWQQNVELNELAPFFTAIYVRDPLSQAELARIGVSAQVVPDLTLSLECDQETLPRKGLIINGSVIPHVLVDAWKEKNRANRDAVSYMSIRTLPPYPTKRSREHFAGLYSRKRRKMLRHIVASYFRPYSKMVTGKGLSRLRWRHAVLSTEKFLQRIKGSEGVITGRFHMVTLCIVTRTPFYALRSNTFKIEGLLQEVGLTDRICSSYAEGISRKDKIQFSDAELATISSYVGDARRKSRSMFQEIHDAVSRRQAESR
ncbi:Polysaccharide pyruvyl transferase [Pseudomonas saudimassiliensis]|uniref:Polysaccharide pyruvyl transferase n=1 Tax=Pseudomonas saudimassiliensis TaxID=1461581 RepID=A0A078MET9_9PSED|nr:Polysaccharide pyruvyl transferase [Pseudomonas saudimassiliensis]CEF27352.1 Polysaccharide pyruvyl transferase [Pseudomonas saudimassiliensis]